MEEVALKKSIKQRLVYDFFYPGILGSILYDILPLQNNISFFIKLIIVIFFALDYFHLYFVLDNKIEPAKKDTWGYVGCDFLVAVFIFIAFKYSEKDPVTVVWFISLIPFLFLIYSLILKYNRIFYSLFTVGCLLLAYFISPNLKLEDPNSNYFVLGTLSAITITYLIYVLWAIISSDKN